jgi:salicylate hydroxylase
LIIGGGIGGSILALALLRQGCRVTLFERAEAIGDVGAGLTLAAPATRGLYSLGLKDALMAVSNRPGPSTALHYQTGEALQGSFKDRSWKPEELELSHMIHRADLLDLVHAAISKLDPDVLRLGHTLQGFEQDADGVTAHFEGGRTARGAALIGCDGVRSTVRGQMFGDIAPRFTGQIAYRFLVPIEKARPFMQIAGPYIGPGRMMARYPVRQSTLVNCDAFITADSWTGEGWSQRCSVEELQALFAGWHRDVLGLAANAPVDGTAKWALYDRDPLDVWVQARVALLGDAAHPMLPFLGLGAGMGIEDAVVLGRAFGELHDPQAALQAYQSTRSARAGLILLESRRQGQLFREGPDGTTKYTLTTHAERMAYDPSSVPLS